MIRTADLVVVGGGIVGLAALDAARRRGLEAVCLEERRPGAGESGGEARILRHLHRDPRLVALTRASAAAWRRLGAELGEELLGRGGVAVLGATDADAALLAAAGVAHRAADDLPLPTPVAGPVLYDEEGGSLLAARAVALLADRARAALVAERAHRVVVEADDSALAVADSAMWRARRVLVCAGAGTPRLAAPLGLEIPLRVEQHVRVTFRLRRPEQLLPCLLDRSETFGGPAYALPLPAGRYGVGIEHQHADRPTETLARAAAYVRAALPPVEPEPVGIRSCLASSLPDDPDAFAVWRRGPVSLFAGGNVFKHALVIGEALVAHALDEAQDVVPSASAPGVPVIAG